MKYSKKQYNYYSDDERMSYIREYLSSPESKSEFCKRHGFCAKLLTYWLNKYQIEDKDMGRSSKPVNSDAIDSSISELQKELSLLRAENRKLHRALADESLRHEACEELINLAESTYHIKVRKLRCQVIDTLSQRHSPRRKRGCIKFLCDYFGITRQGYYKHVNRHLEVDILTTSIVLYCKELLELMPKAGMRELYACCVSKFGPKMVIGRDRCYDIFRSNGLCQRTSRKRPKTTNSNHNYYIYPDLLNVAPKFVATRLGAMVVADITYVNTGQGWAYLSLLTDASSRAIVGYALYKTLETEGPLKALEMAISFYEKYHIDMSTLIHHSDRGVQYCSNKYVERLKEHQINISMTQCGDPLHNALAERMNNTIKNGWLFDCDDESFEQVSKRIEDAVYVYNHVRPHQGINMRTPMEVVSETGGLTA